MTRRVVVLSFALCLIGLWGGGAAAAIGGSAGDNSPLLGLLEIVRGDDKWKREKAVLRMVEWRRELEVSVSEDVSRLVSSPDTTWGSVLDMSASLVGDYRLRQAQGALVGIVELKLDLGSFPKGDKPVIERYFPAALALARGGDQKMIPQLVHRIVTSDSDAVLRNATWVIREYHGKTAAAAVLNEAAAVRGDDAGKRRLLAAIALLDDSVILRLK